MFMFPVWTLACFLYPWRHRFFIFESYFSDEPISASDYFGLGKVTEFNYGKEIYNNKDKIQVTIKLWPTTENTSRLRRAFLKIIINSQKQTTKFQKPFIISKETWNWTWKSKPLAKIYLESLAYCLQMFT